jgi:hypothetical protein
MRTIVLLALGSMALAGCAPKEDAGVQKKEVMVVERSMAQEHMGHVMTGWDDTPGEKGLLITAIAEAEIAAKYAGIAAKKPGDLSWMKTNIGHVLNAVDPSVEAKGAGLGYGVKRAARGAGRHTEFAAASEGASKDVKLRAGHVNSSVKNVDVWANLIISMGKRVKSANSAAAAAPLISRIKTMSEALIAGIDANGDGKVTWKKGEGGLAEARNVMNIMMKNDKF